MGEAGDTEEEESEEQEQEQQEEMRSEVTGAQLPNGSAKSVNCNKKNRKVLSSSQRARAPLAPALRTHSQQYPSPATTAKAASLPNARVSLSLPAPTRGAHVPSSPPKTNPLDETFEGWPVSPPPTQTIRTFGDEDAVVQVPNSQELNKAHAEPEETHDVVYNEQEQGHASETMGDEVQQPEAEVTVIDVPQDEQQALPDMNDQHQEGDAGMTVGAEESNIDQAHVPVLPEETGK